MKTVWRGVGLSLVVVLLLVVGMVSAGEEPDAALTNGEGNQVDGASDFSPPGTVLPELGHLFEEFFTELFGEVDPALFDWSEEPSLIQNGTFDEWSGGVPAGWTVWGNGTTGWEVAHPSQVDLAVSPEGASYALGWFIRNTGGSGSYTAGAFQQLDLIPAPGYYFVSLSEAIWDSGEIPYNSIAWYAISDQADPWSVAAADWRELDPYDWQCQAGSVCNYAGRDETLWIEPGDTFHIRVQQKFPQYNAWSFFLIDDISIIAADPESPLAGDPNGFFEWLDWSDESFLGEDEKCHYDVEDCYPYVPVDVYIPQ